jgi:hypothetical protein
MGSDRKSSALFAGESLVDRGRGLGGNGSECDGGDEVLCESNLRGAAMLASE